jgi:protein-tyrosine phosphatase
VHEQHAALRQELNQIERFLRKVRRHRNRLSPPGTTASDDDHALPHISDDHILEHISVAFEDIPEDRHESVRMVLMHPTEDTSLRERVIDVVKNAGAGGWGEIEDITKIQEVIRRLSALHVLSHLNFNSPYTYRVDRRLIRGSRPTPEKLQRLYAGGCRATINLCREMDDGDEGAIRDADLPGPMDTKHIRITDNIPPTGDQVKELFDHLQSLVGQVYIHCEAGVGRTGVMVACYRMATGWTLPDALREARQFGCSVPDQVTFIEDQALAFIDDLASTATTALAAKADPPSDEQLRQTAAMNKDPIGLDRAFTP